MAGCNQLVNIVFATAPRQFAHFAAVAQHGNTVRHPHHLAHLGGDEQHRHAVAGQPQYFIGGASASGGVGKVMGAVIGAFIMGVMNNGMSIMGIGIDYQQIIKGLVLLAAVFVDVYNKNKG
jgi:ABC-type xylose transport system permease subunit